MKKSFHFEGDAPVRLDILLAGVFEGTSRSKIGEYIKKVGVEVEGKLLKKPGAMVQPGEEVECEGIGIQGDGPTKVEPNADVACEILYEDDACVIVNKAPGVLSHPTAEPESFRTSAASWLLAHLHGTIAGGDAQRPGIVHRLDQWTSGCLLMAKTPEALSFYASAFEKRSVVKEYLALVEGTLQYTKGTIDAPIGRHTRNRTMMSLQEDGRHASTSYEVCGTGELYGVAVSLLRLRIHTGRTHQIRVHLAAIGHPVVGDATYGAKMLPSELSGQWLHARQLTVPRFDDQMQSITATAALPSDFQKVLANSGIEIA